MQVKIKKWTKVIKTSCHRPVMKYKRKKKRDLSGKFVILLNSESRKVGALLKFVSQKTCKVVSSITIKKCDLKQTSRKFIISPKRNKRLLNTIKVIVNLEFQRRYEQIVEKVSKENEKRAKNKLKATKTKAAIPPTKPTFPVLSTPVKAQIIQEPKKITPIKIFNCLLCNHKFTKRSVFEEHLKTHKTRRDSSGSDNELLIDDDVMYVIEPENPQLPHKPQGELKSEPSDPTPEKFVCMTGYCQMHFDNEQALIAHIGIHHDRVEPSKFMCEKCPVTFHQKSGLIAHCRLSHAVAYNPELEEGDPEVTPKARRKSMYVSDPSKLSPKISQQVFSPLGAATSSNGKITFGRFNSMHRKNFVCRICSISFQQRQLLDRHVTAQHISKLYYCYKCTTPFPIQGLIVHLRSMHQDCATEQEFVDTLADVESVAMYRCAFCQFGSRIWMRVETHLRFEHYEEYEKCEDRDQQVSSSDSLEELLLPETAKIIADTESELKKIEQEKRKRRPLNDPSFKFRCVRCQRRFLKSCTLRKHSCSRSERILIPIKQHSELPKVVPKISKATGSELVVMNGFHRCPRCPQVFTDQINFQKHVTEAHDMHQSPKTGFYGTIIN